MSFFPSSNKKQKEKKRKHHTRRLLFVTHTFKNTPPPLPHTPHDSTYEQVGVSSVDSMDSTNSPRGGIAAIIARRVPPRRRAGALLPRLLRARAGAMVKGTVVPLETLRADAKAKSKAHPTVFGGKSGNPKPAMNRKGSKGATPKTAVRWHGPQGGRSMAQRGVAK